MKDVSCIVCFEMIPKERLKCLPNTTKCVKCSDETKFSAVHVIHHKTGNEVQIVKNPETAAEFQRLSARAGFGTLRGMKAGKTSSEKPKIITQTKTVTRTFAKPSMENIERYGAKAFEIAEADGSGKSIRFIKELVTSRAITQLEGIRLQSMVLTVFNTSIDTNDVKPKSTFKNDDTKISEEIEYAFRNWKI